MARRQKKIHIFKLNVNRFLQLLKFRLPRDLILAESTKSWCVCVCVWLVCTSVQYRSGFCPCRCGIVDFIVVCCHSANSVTLQREQLLNSVNYINGSCVLQKWNAFPIRFAEIVNISFLCVCRYRFFFSPLTHWFFVMPRYNSIKKTADLKSTLKNTPIINFDSNSWTKTVCSLGTIYNAWTANDHFVLYMYSVRIYLSTQINAQPVPLLSFIPPPT